MKDLDLAINIDSVIYKPRNIYDRVRTLPFHQQLAVLSQKQQQNIINNLELAYACLPVVITPVSLTRNA